MSLWLHVTVTNTINKKPLREERVGGDSTSKAQPIAEVRIGAKLELEAEHGEVLYASPLPGLCSAPAFLYSLGPSV